jgi:hypothetical protein
MTLLNGIESTISDTVTKDSSTQSRVDDLIEYSNLKFPPITTIIKYG